jgi:hypothetical protein
LLGGESGYFSHRLPFVNPSSGSRIIVHGVARWGEDWWMTCCLIAPKGRWGQD